MMNRSKINIMVAKTTARRKRTSKKEETITTNTNSNQIIIDLSQGDVYKQLILAKAKIGETLSESEADYLRKILFAKNGLIIIYGDPWGFKTPKASWMKRICNWIKSII